MRFRKKKLWFWNKMAGWGC